jgi:hypothetical protein
MQYSFVFPLLRAHPCCLGNGVCYCHVVKGRPFVEAVLGISILAHIKRLPGGQATPVLAPNWDLFMQARHAGPLLAPHTRS